MTSDNKHEIIYQVTPQCGVSAPGRYLDTYTAFLLNRLSPIELTQVVSRLNDLQREVCKEHLFSVTILPSLLMYAGVALDLYLYSFDGRVSGGVTFLLLLFSILLIGRSVRIFFWNRRSASYLERLSTLLNNLSSSYEGRGIIFHVSPLSTKTPVREVLHTVVISSIEAQAAGLPAPSGVQTDGHLINFQLAGNWCGGVTGTYDSNYSPALYGKVSQAELSELVNQINSLQEEVCRRYYCLRLLPFLSCLIVGNPGWYILYNLVFMIRYPTAWDNDGLTLARFIFVFLLSFWGSYFGATVAGFLRSRRLITFQDRLKLILDGYNTGSFQSRGLLLHMVPLVNNVAALRDALPSVMISNITNMAARSTPGYLQVSQISTGIPVFGDVDNSRVVRAIPLYAYASVPGQDVL